MAARIVWIPRKMVRRIDQRARQTADPVERLRYVRNLMDSTELPALLRWWPVRRIAAWIWAVAAAGLLVWRIR